MNPNLKFCRADGCKKPAIGGHKAISNEYCRPDLLKAVAGELVECRVLGSDGEADTYVAGLDGVSVGRGGTVRLHPAETDIDALVYAGLVEVVEQPKPARPTAGKDA